MSLQRMSVMGRPIRLRIKVIVFLIDTMYTAAVFLLTYWPSEITGKYGFYGPVMIPVAGKAESGKGTKSCP